MITLTLLMIIIKVAGIVLYYGIKLTVVVLEFTISFIIGFIKGFIEGFTTEYKKGRFAASL